MRLVPINCIKEDSYLAQPLFDGEGRVLLKKGVQLNEGLLKKVEEVGVYSLYIMDEYSDQEIEDIIKPQMRIRAIKTIKDTFKIFEKSLQQNQQPKKQKQLEQEREKQIGSLKEVSKDIVDEILGNRNIMINLVDIKSLDNYTYEHSVSTAVLSLVLGIELGLNKNELYDLCIGAMLHDIGKVFIPKDILFKENRNEKEQLLVQSHSQKGYEYLKENSEVSGLVKIIVLQHHEHVDGSGYPAKIKDAQINKLAKIVAITDQYDRFTSGSPSQKPVSPHEAIEYVMGSAGRYFDFNMARTFVHKVIPYPVGSLVRLSNGDVGVVDEVIEQFPLRPRVRIIRQNANRIEMEFVELMKEINLVIEGMLHEVPNVSVQHYLKTK
ncbi:HD-GYP domain, c-di-GMP phosphodiesterase class II (or its inactivated variant) [Geosporobacter subterraneus DSM 17957]|uniref:HD-GYP domain, c-di-GMP phosphodiesterase class II (Or its inactivated variant) n=1 Tax=Geosporobacter subterraneus DSM 17957 TaxID=1121919 RepID=A0A1M6D3H2_9FIRM|nr:HD-GYP domain-containing protein [Geosporobacter subterraneus]SHI67800.1 HD-GYP domain, c-di-GMP phosphodiesterase class II (or its inactivated variant) [Geosporobacter subterraneus DSM 17957]